MHLYIYIHTYQLYVCMCIFNHTNLYAFITFFVIRLGLYTVLGGGGGLQFYVHKLVALLTLSRLLSGSVAIDSNTCQGRGPLAFPEVLELTKV